MISREMRHIAGLLVMAAFGMLLIHPAAAQEKTGSVQSAETLAQNLKPGGLTQTRVSIQPVQPNELARSLSRSQHAIMSSPREGIVSSLVEAKLPPSSLKKFSVRGMSEGDFLAPTKVRPTDWQHLNLTKVNASKLQNDKRPNITPLE